MSKNQTEEGRLPLLNRILECYEELKGPKRKIADLIVGDPESVVFMTSADVAIAAGCSQPTVSRFASDIGFAGFAAFQSALRDQLKHRMTPVNRMISISSKNTDAAGTAFFESLQADQAILQGLSDRVNLESVGKAVELIRLADKVAVTGSRNSYTAAFAMNFLLNQLIGKSQLITERGEDLEELSSLETNDLVISFSFSRYGRRVVEMTKAAHKASVPVLAITDSPTSPIARFADVALYVDCRGPMFQNSMVGALTAVNGLIMSLVATMTEEMREESQQHMEKVDQLSESLGNFYLPNEPKY
ncbi:RpiR family transcriptional regulator [Scopulibacillus darangshiensis]|uniref:RpiR family transcriptional regulator n=1 Tax=Scopulibacillus darangshiensis TaxID=442528 RepID=A0A4R2NPR6_9BACL|nr:MurR/RpiR family transcriptional regulator [Scopulibacillus darangshiensis]TCP23770.1 RpiR family transcriptional regulator [Scopulibacillus darangshiensis]